MQTTFEKTNQTAAVTGANGFIGSHLVDLLLEQGWTVKCLVRQASDIQWLEGKDCQIIRCGLEDINTLNMVLEGVDYIFHLAGLVNARKYSTYKKANVDMTKNLLEASLSHQDKIKRILVMSSLGATGSTLSYMPVNEKTPCQPISAYGESKLEQEQLARNYMNWLPITIIRPPAVYGERDKEILLMFKTIKRGIRVLIGSSDKTVSLIYVKDLVKGVFQAVLAPKAKNQVYFLSSENQYTWAYIGALIQQELGVKAFQIKFPHILVKSFANINSVFSGWKTKPPTLSLERAKSILQESWSCSSEKAKQDFGFQESFTLAEGIARTARWYKKNNWL